MAAGFTETLPLVRQHDRLQPHQVLAPAATGAMDVGNAGRNGDGVGQCQPAGRRLRRRCGGGLLLSLILGLILALLSGLVGLLLLGRRLWLGRRRIGRTRLRQRHRHRRPAHLSPRSWRRIPEQVGPRRRAPGFRREGGRCWHAKQEAGRDNGNHCRCNAAKGAISPFSACFLRGKVHFNSMNLTPIRPKGSRIVRQQTKPSEGNAYARIDARLAFALSPDYRTRGEVSRHARGRYAVGRRSHSSHQLRRNSCARAESIATARARRHQARRPRRHHRLEHLAPSRSLVRHHGNRRDLPHRQSAAVPRPDRLDHQPCAGSRGHDRHHLRADPGKDRRQPAERRTLHRADRQGAHAADHAEERGRL